VTPPTGWLGAWCDRLGLDPVETARRAGAIWGPGELGTCTLADVEGQVATLFGLDEGPSGLGVLMDDLWAEYLGTLNRDLAQFFATLRPRYRTGILSNSFVGARERERRAYNFEAMCDVVIYSHEEGMQKPDPRFFEVACTRLGVAAASVLFVDDVAGHVEAARSLGMQGVQFSSNEQAIGEITALLSGEA
jgi:HAD superfamily hydrolase (TIGR01509 family)